MSFLPSSKFLKFLLVIAVLTCVLVLLVNPVLKMIIETQGSKAAGAKVELDAVDLDFFPASLTLEGLSVANKNAPMSNLFQFEKFYGELEFGPLLGAKFIVPEAQLSKLAFDTARRTSGAIPGLRPSESETGSSLDDLKASAKDAIPSVDEILEKEPLKTLELADKFKESYGAHELEFKEAKAALPSKDRLKEIEKEFKPLFEEKLTSLEDFTQRKARFDELRAELEKAKRSVDRLQNVVIDGTQDLGSQYHALKDAPEVDFERLSAKYSLDGAGASQLVSLLLGGEAAQWFEQGLAIYDMVLPLMQGSGESESAVELADQSEASDKQELAHLPDVWVKRLLGDVSLANDRGQLAFEASDLSSDSALTNKITRFDVKGADLKGLKNFVLNGNLDLRSAAGLMNANVDVDQLDLKDAALGGGDISLASALANIVGQLSLKGDQLSAEGDVKLLNTVFSAAKGELDSKESVLFDLLSGLDSLAMQVLADGALEDPNVRIKSDLDRQLKNLLGNAAKGKLDEYKPRLLAKLNEKVGLSSEGYDEYLASLEGADGESSDLIEGLLNQDMGSYEALLKQQAQKKIDQQKDKLENKLKDKLGDKLKGLF